uniref:thiol oxidase n=1 Tax=viral metagenome TaxID=1070528 RepID=A0A6C0EKY8_9ZZZZ
MYATASEYLGLYQQPRSTLFQKQYVSHPSHTVTPPVKEHFVDMTWKEEHISGTANPDIWGPPYWFSLHVSATHYPENPSPIVRERMKNRILAIPYEIPCAGCRPHASAFIEQKRNELDSIVSNRHSLGRFFVDFHNKVNERYGKPKWTYEQAYAYYSGNTRVRHMGYK